MAFFKNYHNTSQKDIFGDRAKCMHALFTKSNREYYKLLPFIGQYIYHKVLRSNKLFQNVKLEHVMIGIDPYQGRFLYNMVTVIQPKTIFEFGLSHGISTIYMAQALKNTKANSSTIISTENIDHKIQQAKSNIQKMQLEQYIQILAGDVLQTVKTIKTPIDFVFMDGFPNLNLQVFKLIEQKLSPNTMIITDDINIFTSDMQAYLDYLYSSGILLLK